MRELMASIRAEVHGRRIVVGCAVAPSARLSPRSIARWSRPASRSASSSRVLSRLADYIERRNALVQKIVLAFTYPAIVTVVAFAIVIFLLTYVVPQIVSVFANTKQKLPFLTVMMLARLGLRAQLLAGRVLLRCRAGSPGVSALRNPDLKHGAGTLAADRAAVRQIRAQAEHRALCQHAGDHHRLRRADPARTANQPRNAVERGDARTGGRRDDSVREGVGLARALSATQDIFRRC